MLQTALHRWHVDHGGRMVDFAGWHMPIQYTSIVEEHHAVRQRAGMFDIAHMGRIWFCGADAVKLLNLLLTNDVSQMKLGQVRYSLICQGDGGILDDVLIYRFPEDYLLVVNGANREKIMKWIESHRSGYQINVDDTTLLTCMMALQGPAAESILQPWTKLDLSSISYYHTARTEVCGVPAVLSRTGYTGEDGFEVTVASDSGAGVWSQLMDSGKSAGVVPCGLGCRDTLRLEAGMPLYGHELDETINPIVAGLKFGVKLDKETFIGKAALLDAAKQEQLPQRVGLELKGKRIARQGAEIYRGDEKIGTVTSGTFSPTLQKPLAMGYVASAASAPGTLVEIDIRGHREPAEVVSLPFYKRPAN